MTQFTLGELAEHIGAEVKGDESIVIRRLASLDDADNESVSFLANARYAKKLADTKAAAVIVSEKHVDACETNALISMNPYIDYAKISMLFDNSPKRNQAVHPSAQIASSAEIASDVFIGANVVIESGATIAAGVVIEPNVYIGANVSIGENSRIFPNVTIYHEVKLGSNVTIHSGTVIGADGFGFAPTKEGWRKIAQIGSVIIGDNIEIGANTTIDRGALDNTVIGDGVILDNQIQIGHNVKIGDYTAIAACAGIAGSTQIGSHCLIGGGARIAGHLRICDNVQISATAFVINSISEPDVYSSGVVADKHRHWLKNATRFRKLTDLFKRVDKIEKKLEQ